MKPEKFKEAQWRKNINTNAFITYRNGYLYRHPSFFKFEFPKYFYFKVLDDRCAIHWAVIREENKKFIVYFINVEGKAFDRLEFRTKKHAQRGLKRNKFSFCTNKKCPYLPVSPIYVRLGKGKKSAPYSIGHLWNPPATILHTKKERTEHYQKAEEKKEASEKVVKDKYRAFFEWALIVIILTMVHKPIFKTLMNKLFLLFNGN